MGDLEYFYLPIIFKSHVTGFEPTKDLYLEPGNVVAGQYLVQGELGSAAFSTAYRCVDLNSQGSGPDGHEEVCLKVIKNTKDYFDQSLDEIKILELLRQTGKCHEKNIIEMKTFFYHREHLIIVTELLRQNLFEFGKFVVDHNEEPYFTLPRLSYITRQTLVALDFIHQMGLVHSDVKPENLLLGSYSRAQCKLIDFGSSCYLTDRQSSYIQSRSYRAPEVILGLPYDGRIDIWSLGCVVAEMFTGEVTFQNDSVVSMLSRIEAICGPFPRSMIVQGRQSGRFFTKCSLLFERVSKSDDDDDDSDSSEADAPAQHFDIFQAKKTTLSARLGFAPDLMEDYDAGKSMTQEQTKQANFVDFCRQMLTVDPDRRPTAAQALEHPWMQYAASLTEEDIKYPS
jgi:serine/threonine protein kinase